MLRTALALAQKGLAVFPCRPRDKRPATEHGLHNATTDLDTIRRWWGREPQFNIAVATGAVSGIFVVDVDGLDAEAELQKLESEHSELPDTVEVITARPGGRHIYFRWPETPVRNSAGKIAPGIDTRGEGGYVIVPPSIHPSGRAYAWSVDSSNAFAVAPDWLLAKVTERTDRNGNGSVPSSEWRKIVTTGAAEGTRNATATRLAGYLLRHHVDPFVSLTLLQSWNATHCVPPLSEKDVERIVGSICKRELLRRRADG